MNKANISKKKYITICAIFAAVLIAIGIGISYAILSIPVNGNYTESSITSGDYGFTSNLSSATAISEKNLGLIEEDEIADLAPSTSFTVRAQYDRDDIKFNIYLKDIAISNNLIDSIGSFKWQLLRNGTVIEQGDFRNIDNVGVKNSNTVDTATVKYFESYDLKDGLSFDGLNTSEFTFRVYILNDDIVDQTALTNGTFQAKLGAASYIANYKCTRARTLHTNDSTTYGSLGKLTSTPEAGDAFDCDVNGDGKFDATTERYYYVSNAWRNGTFNQNVAVLISANNRAISSWGPNIGNGLETALGSLPTTSQWRNVSLSNITRNIYQGTSASSTSTIASSSFSYTDKAARLLTIQELMEGCPNASTSLSACNWLLENTQDQDAGFPIGYWLETAYSNTSAWIVNGSSGNLSNDVITNDTDYVVRPAIEVPVVNINY